MGSDQLIVFRVADGSPLPTLDLILGGHRDQEWAGVGEGGGLDPSWIRMMLTVEMTLDFFLPDQMWYAVHRQ